MFGWDACAFFVVWLSHLLVTPLCSPFPLFPHQKAVFDRYGPLATLSFFLALIFRLYQEVWSNALVVASFYGEYDSVQWWLAAIISTVIPFAYVTLGGLRSSLLSDLWQAILAVVLLVVLMASILVKMNHSIRGLCEQAGNSQCRLWTYDVNPGVSSWSLEGGWDLIVVGLLQSGFSYPYFDPVLTGTFLLATNGIFPSSWPG